MPYDMQPGPKPGCSRPTSAVLVAEYMRLLANGKSIHQIAAALGLPKGQLWREVRHAGLFAESVPEPDPPLAYQETIRQRAEDTKGREWARKLKTKVA